MPDNISVQEILGTVYDAVIIGTGFGGAVAALKMIGAGKSVLMIERGTWWGNPEGPAVAPTPPIPMPTIGGHTQTRQWWTRPNNDNGMTYLYDTVYKGSPFPPETPLAPSRDVGPVPNAKGLYRYRRFEHANGRVDIVTSSGVGGGSLIYSGVNLQPEAEILRRIGLNLTDAHYRAAAEWMKKNRGRMNKIVTKVPVPARVPGPPNPGDPDLRRYQIPAGSPSGVRDYEMPDPILPDHEEDYLLLDRSRVLRRAIEAARAELQAQGAEVGEWRPLPLSVLEYDPEKGGESEKKNAFCLRQGRCMLGCLPSARHTLYKTLQTRLIWSPGPGEHAVRLLPETRVIHIDRVDQGFEVEIDSRYAFGSRVVKARQVFLAAGVLGTNEILLRSKKRFDDSGKGLHLSQRIGTRFTTNGDFFGFALHVNESKFGKVNPTDGPINASGFHLIFDRGQDQRVDLHIEDCGIPPAFAEFAQAMLAVSDNYLSLARVGVAALANMSGAATPFLGRRGAMHRLVGVDPDPSNKRQPGYETEQMMVDDVFFFRAMGAAANEPLGTFKLDPLTGAMNLEFDRDIRTNHPAYAKLEQVCALLSDTMGGVYRQAPLWQHENRMIVVHPLGGCPIGADRTSGACDEFGRLFDGSANSPTAVIPGLYVVDSAAIPGSLAVNPTLTIVAQAIKSVERAATE